MKILLIHGILLSLPALTCGFTLSSLASSTRVDSKVSKGAYTSSSSSNARTTSSTALFDKYEPFAAYQSAMGQQEQGEIRPLHQNWWPCIVEANLDETRPNPVEVLGTKLVLWKSEGDWSCLEDKCSHRFAPLSEGRVVVMDEVTKKTCLQCSYHGWEFNQYGRCQKVPQTGLAAGAKPVPAHPVKVAAGMVWVYMDASTPDIAGSLLPLPISPLLTRWHAAHGDAACYMRDLPYGYELLGENLMDLSHLPYSHHTVGPLTRDLGGPIPFQMLSAAQKKQIATEQQASSGGISNGRTKTPLQTPLYQAKIVDAHQNDPLFKGRPVPENSTATVSFYEASHIRYTRNTLPGQSSEVQLFLCPISPGKSRIFLYNVFEPALLGKEAEIKAKEKKKIKIKPTKKPADGTKTQSKWKQYLFSPRKTIMTKVMKKMMRPDGYRSHLFSNKLFDGDGLFLQLQGDRMQRAGLTYKDYATPASADILVNAFRRYLEAASEKTLATTGPSGGATMATMVQSANPKADDNAYTADLPRSVALDRYESHTAHCKVCSSELTKRQRLHRRLGFLQTAMTGAAGASTLSLLMLFVVGSEVTVPINLLRCAVAATVSTDMAVVGLHRAQVKVQKSVDAFLFEDYVHADK